jgi:ectoine hydroxylase-related dioxygenase (phytanoyl-CoA dioxygenase family)
MNIHNEVKEEIDDEGFAVINDVFTEEEIAKILRVISSTDTSKPTFRKTTDLFAIRQFFKEIPSIAELIFNQNLRALISNIFGDEYFVVKAIYFDKPETSNWFVAYHQDLTISVNKKIALEGFGPWTVKQDQFAVQPPLDILQDNFTVRVHLDNTGKENGALKVIPKSHVKGVYRLDAIDPAMKTESICSVTKGGVMIMKPLLLHSSGRTVNNNKRRVVHIEFSRSVLPNDLKWSEYFQVESNSA